MDKNASTFVTLEIIGRFRELNDMMGTQTVAVLCHIARNPDIANGQLSRITGLSLSTIGRSIDLLGDGGRSGAGLGLVVRYEDPVDRRTKRSKLTKKGEKWFEEFAETVSQAVEKALPKESA